MIMLPDQGLIKNKCDSWQQNKTFCGNIAFRFIGISEKVVYCDQKSFHLSKIQTEMQHFEDRPRQEVVFLKKREKRS